MDDESSNMFSDDIYNLNIVAERLLPSPREVKERLPLTQVAKATVTTNRHAVENILDRKDPRLLVVVGPCSIHDLGAAREYAGKLAELSKKVSKSLVLLMRVYFEKPRTSVGWKGLINDPYLDDSFRIDEGLHLARGLLLEIANLELGTATEALDPIAPQYFHDLISWTAIGARTTESQTHREMSSGLSTPVGFKNGTDGNISVAINALTAVSQPHHFLGVDREGKCAVFQTRGNRFGHVVLRGGTKPNYDAVSVASCERELAASKLPSNIMVDCSHGNSLKDFTLQPLVMENCVHQILEGNRSIMGLMIESHLFAGAQKLTPDRTGLKYGVSVTDGCIGWTETEQLLIRAAERLEPVLEKRLAESK